MPSMARQQIIFLSENNGRLRFLNKKVTPTGKRNEKRAAQACGPKPLMAHGPQQAIGIHNTNINRLQSTCARISESGLTGNNIHRGGRHAARVFIRLSPKSIWCSLRCLRFFLAYSSCLLRLLLCPIRLFSLCSSNRLAVASTRYYCNRIQFCITTIGCLLFVLFQHPCQ